jgi:hypothetical protein
MDGKNLTMTYWILRVVLIVNTLNCPLADNIMINKKRIINFTSNENTNHQ